MRWVGGSPSKISEDFFPDRLGGRISYGSGCSGKYNSPASTNTNKINQVENTSQYGNHSESTQQTDTSRTDKDVEKTTTFFDDHQQTSHVVDHPTHFVENNHSDYSHSIVEFLERPTKIYQQTVTTTQDDVLDFDLHTPGKYQPFIFNIRPDVALIQSIKNKKLDGFNYFKADIKIKMTINTSPLVTGKFLLAYNPGPAGAYANEISSKSLTTISGYPTCYIDPQLDTSVEFIVPYHYEEDAIELSKTFSTQMHLYLFAVTPTRNVSASSPLVFTVYANYCNIDLFAPTWDVINGQVQMDLLTDIVSGISGAASWTKTFVKEQTSGTWHSRPTISNSVQHFQNVPGAAKHHIKGLDNSVSLAMNQDYGLNEPTNVFQTQDNEMMIEYICNNPVIVAKQIWGVTGTFLMTSNLSPAAINTGITDYEIVTPFGYLARLFSFWRADFVYRLTIAKTAFHSGRLEIVFTPSQAALALPGTTDCENTYRAILDITTDTEIEITIPYVSNLLMESTATGSIGTLSIRPVAPLIAAATVEPFVDLVLHMYTKNVIFSGNTHPETYRPILNVPAATADVLDGEIQINLVTKDTTNKVTFFKPQKNMKDARDAVGHIGGDTVHDLRALCKSFMYSGLSFTRPENTLSARPTTQTGNVYRLDYVSYLQPLYKFFRGGMRFKIYSLVNTNQVLVQPYLGAPSVRTPDLTTFNLINPVNETAVPYLSQFRRTANEGITGFDYGIYASVIGVDPVDSRVYVAGDDDFTYGWMLGPPAVVRL